MKKGIYTIVLGFSLGIFTSYFIGYIKDDRELIHIKYDLHQPRMDGNTNFLIDGVTELVDEEGRAAFTHPESCEENAVEVFFVDV